jgi:hypothetical protein
MAYRSRLFGPWMFCFDRRRRCTSSRLAFVSFCSIPDRWPGANPWRWSSPSPRRSRSVCTSSRTGYGSNPARARPIFAFSNASPTMSWSRDCFCTLSPPRCAVIRRSDLPRNSTIISRKKTDPTTQEKRDSFFCPGCSGQTFFHCTHIDVVKASSVISGCNVFGYTRFWSKQLSMPSSGCLFVYCRFRFFPEWLYSDVNP